MPNSAEGSHFTSWKVWSAGPLAEPMTMVTSLFGVCATPPYKPRSHSACAGAESAQQAAATAKSQLFMLSSLSPQAEHWPPAAYSRPAVALLRRAVTAQSTPGGGLRHRQQCHPPERSYL